MSEPLTEAQHGEAKPEQISITEAVADDTAAAIPPADPANGSQPGAADARADDAPDQIAGIDDEDQDDAPDDSKAGREARYRQRAQAAEARADAAEAQLAALRMAEVQRIAAEPGPIPEGETLPRPVISQKVLAASGLDLDAVIDPETGVPDRGLVERHLVATAAEFEIVHREPRGFKPNRGLDRGRGSVPPGFEGDTGGGIADAFRR